MSILDQNFGALLAFMTAIVAMVAFTVLHLNARKGKVSVEFRQDGFGTSFRTEAEFGCDNENPDLSHRRLEPSIDYQPPVGLPPLVESVPIPSLPEAIVPKKSEKKLSAADKEPKPKRRTGR